MLKPNAIICLVDVVAARRFGYGRLSLDCLSITEQESLAQSH